MERHVKARHFAGSFIVIALIALAAPFGHAAGSNPLADEVRQANDRFSDVKAAMAEGYAPIPCASGGAMGIHYINAGYRYGLVRSTSCMSGPGGRTRTAPSPI
jgi:hypothetical protein